jgi:hypothetical protein
LAEKYVKNKKLSPFFYVVWFVIYLYKPITNRDMNFYETRLNKLKGFKLSSEVYGDGRERYKDEDLYRSLKVGDKIYPTVWFLRNIDEIDLVVSVAVNGLTVIEVGEIYDPEGKWELGSWVGCNYKCYWFKEIARPMSFKNMISQLAWKYTKL